MRGIRAVAAKDGIKSGHTQRNASLMTDHRFFCARQSDAANPAGNADTCAYPDQLHFILETYDCKSDISDGHEGAWCREGGLTIIIDDYRSSNDWPSGVNPRLVPHDQGRKHSHETSCVNRTSRTAVMSSAIAVVASPG